MPLTVLPLGLSTDLFFRVIRAFTNTVRRFQFLKVLVAVGLRIYGQMLVEKKRGQVKIFV